MKLLILISVLFISAAFSQSDKPAATIEITTTEQTYSDYTLINHTQYDYFVNPFSDYLLRQRDRITLYSNPPQYRCYDSFSSGFTRKTIRTKIKVYIPEKKVFTRGQIKIRGRK